MRSVATFESKLFKFHDVQLRGFYVNLLTVGHQPSPGYTDGSDAMYRNFGC